MIIRDLHTLLEYNSWATRHLLEAVTELSSEQWTQQSASGDSLQRQSGHLVLTVDAYRAKLAREPVPVESPERFAQARDLLDYETRLQERLTAYLATLEDDDLHRVGEVPMGRGSVQCAPREVLLHMVNHSTYHRGQIASLLKERGVDYPETDLIGWFDKRRESGEAPIRS